MQESTTERLHVVSTVNTSLPQPCKVPIRKAVKETVTAIEKALIAEDFIPNQSVVNMATWLSWTENRWGRNLIDLLCATNFCMSWKNKIIIVIWSDERLFINGTPHGFQIRSTVVMGIVGNNQISFTICIYIYNMYIYTHTKFVRYILYVYVCVCLLHFSERESSPNIIKNNCKHWQNCSTRFFEKATLNTGFAGTTIKRWKTSSMPMYLARLQIRSIE